MLKYNKNLKQYSRELRNNMTDAEKRLWSALRMRQLSDCQFYRQRIIGNYIVDFYCHKAHLVIEVDGSQHYSDTGIKADMIRDKYMKDKGLCVLRFNGIDVLANIEGVVDVILEHLKDY